MQINNDLLKEIAWIDFSIQTDIDQNCILILICKEGKAKNGLYNLLSSEPFSIFFTIEEGIYNIHLQFENANSALSYNTRLDEGGYHPLTWLKEGKVKFVTVGNHFVDSLIIDYYRPLLPFYSISQNMN